MNGLKDVIFQKLDMFKADILKEVPNLKPRAMPELELKLLMAYKILFWMIDEEVS
jgi:hypothetical protein